MASSKNIKASQLFARPAPTLDLATELQRAVTLHRAGQLAQAKAAYERVLAIQPQNFSCLHLLGVLMLQGGQPGDAERLITQAIATQPREAAPYINLALAQSAQKKYPAALDNIDKALALNPNLVEAQVNRGAILVQAHKSQEAIEQFNQLISSGHATAEVWTNRGIALMQLQRYDEALQSYRQALAITPGFAKALYNMGVALIETQQFDQAVEVLDQALERHPQYAEALSAKGQALHGMGKPRDAKPWHERAVALKPRAAPMLVSYANCLTDLREFAPAHQALDAALSTDPQYAEAYVAGGHLLACQGRHEDAIANYDRAIEISPALASAHFFKAHAEITLKRYAPALESLQRASSGRFHTQLTQQHCRMMVCDWTQFDAHIADLCDEVRAGKPSEPTFALLGLVDDPALHLAAASRYARQCSPAPRPTPKRPSAHKIRVGYYSTDFRDHALMFLLAEVLESHDTDRFEIYGFSLTPLRDTEILRRIRKRFVQFLDVHDKSDEEVASLSRALGIDVAVDLNGFTANARFGIFAKRCAPIQVSYLGYPGTTGAEYMDYVIADKVVLPNSEQPHYAEKVAYLPHSYQANDSKRAISSRAFTRQELGLPDQGFVYCCFNNAHKILPATFDGWMRALREVDGSVLWLMQSNSLAADNLRKEAEARGVDGSRLVFAPFMPLDEHLARYRLADLFLDTLPYNAHTTASDALWAGLPVLTCPGRSFASRVAASLLTAVGLPELITSSQAEFEAKAIALARAPQELQALRQKLAAQRLSSPLFNGAQCARYLEAAYTTMYERYQQGLDAETFAVPA